MAELLDTMENFYGELAELVYEHGLYRAYDGYELLAESDNFDGLVTRMMKLGFIF